MQSVLGSVTISIPKMSAQLVSSSQPCLTQGKLREVTEWARLCECRVALRGRRAGECIREEFGFRHTFIGKKMQDIMDQGKSQGKVKESIQGIILIFKATRRS